VKETERTDDGQQWGMALRQAERPPDQWFGSLDEMVGALKEREKETKVEEWYGGQLFFRDSSIYGPAILTLRGDLYSLTNWSLQRVCELLKIPAAYMRRLPSDVLVKNLEQGLRDSNQELVWILHARNGWLTAAMQKSEVYGGVRDLGVVEEAVQLSFSPLIEGEPSDMVISDREIRIYLAGDADHEIVMGDESLYRGVEIVNSEVGGRAFSFTAYTFVESCSGRLLWTDALVRKSSLFKKRDPAYMVVGKMKTIVAHYFKTRTDEIQRVVGMAMKRPLPGGKAHAGLWLKSKKFSAPEVQAMMDWMKMREGDWTIWSAICAGLSHAANIQYCDQRASFEMRVANLLRDVEDNQK